MDFDLICSRFLGNQDWAPHLKDVFHTTARYAAGHHPAGSGSRRKADLEIAARHALGLRTALGKVDLLDLAEIMGPLRGEAIASEPIATDSDHTGDHPADSPGAGPIHQSFVPSRLAELDRFVATLDSVSTALNAKARAVPVRRKRPSLPDPVLFGVEALQALWRAAYGCSPTYGFNKNQFGDFALTVLGPGEVGFEASAVRSAVRKVLTGASTKTIAPEPE